jgi:hypothetical protein
MKKTIVLMVSFILMMVAYWSCSDKKASEIVSNNESLKLSKTINHSITLKQRMQLLENSNNKALLQDQKIEGFSFPLQTIAETASRYIKGTFIVETGSDSLGIRTKIISFYNYTKINQKLFSNKITIPNLTIDQSTRKKYVTNCGDNSSAVDGKIFVFDLDQMQDIFVKYSSSTKSYLYIENGINDSGVAITVLSVVVDGAIIQSFVNDTSNSYEDYANVLLYEADDILDLAQPCPPDCPF